MCTRYRILCTSRIPFSIIVFSTCSTWIWIGCYWTYSYFTAIKHMVVICIGKFIPTSEFISRSAYCRKIT